MNCKAIRLSGAGLIVLACIGCAPRRADMLHFLRENEHQVSAIEYRVGIPDVIRISAPQILEIDGEAQRIQPDGKINLRLVGEVKVVGMTAREITAKLELLLSRYYLEPKVRVRVTYDSKQYYVRNFAGGVSTQGYTGRDTLLDAVVGAGVDFRSMTSQVRVIRPTADDTPVRVILVNVDEMIRNGDWSENVLLEPNDIVVIPPTPAAWIGLRVRELLYPVEPAVRAYTAPATLMNLEGAYEEGEDGRFTNVNTGSFNIGF